MTSPAAIFARFMIPRAEPRRERRLICDRGRSRAGCRTPTGTLTGHGNDRREVALQAWRSSTADAVAANLREATGLQVDVDGGRLRLPELGLGFWGYLVDATSCEVLSPIPAHPYACENLDRILSARGGIRDDHPTMWLPAPEHTALRVRWDELPRRDRCLLKFPPILPSRRVFDRFLSGRRAAG